MSAIWIITDGKPGHYNQSLGLANALKTLQPQLQVETLPALSKRQLLLILVGGALPESLRTYAEHNPPQLLIAAGHATHLSLLLLSRHFKARSVVLMQPSLPCRWFDLCLIPRHDHPRPAANIVETQGALNPMSPGVKHANTGLILIGGPSKHHAWNDDQLLSQLQQLLASSACQWLMTSSRRTPEETLARLKSLEGITFVPFSETPPGWVAAQLSTAEQAWITADSVSMVYEALTAGCAVGVLDVPLRQAERPSRLVKGLEQLVRQGWVHQGVDHSEVLQAVTPTLNEAQRCARLIHDRGWL